MLIDVFGEEKGSQFYDTLTNCDHCIHSIYAMKDEEIGKMTYHNTNDEIKVSDKVYLHCIQDFISHYKRKNNNNFYWRDNQLGNRNHWWSLDYFWLFCEYIWLVIHSRWNLSRKSVSTRLEDYGCIFSIIFLFSKVFL